MVELRQEIEAPPIVPTPVLKFIRTFRRFVLTAVKDFVGAQILKVQWIRFAAQNAGESVPLSY
jgi:hypothetical protein